MKNVEIIELYKNDGLKKAFVANYCKAPYSANAKWTEHQAEQQWLEVFKMLSAGFSDKTQPQIHLASRAELISSILYVSEAGLSFSKSDKEVHLDVEFGPRNHLELKTRLGYKGMLRIAMGTGFFKYITTELVLEGDTFSWLGQSKAPVFVSAGPVASREVVCGFVGFKYKDGDEFYVKIDRDELLEIERSSKAFSALAHGSEDGSLYSTPWRYRMLTIAVWRNAYNRMREIIIFGSARSMAQLDETCAVQLPVETDEFMSVFQEPQAS